MKGCDESPQGKSYRRCDRRWGLISPRTSRTIGCINVTSLGGDKDGKDLLAMNTLSEYGIDICGLSETRWKGTGKKVVGDYTIYFSGGEKAMYGVGIAVS